jgi:hypothetical protein
MKIQFKNNKGLEIFLTKLPPVAFESIFRGR